MQKYYTRACNFYFGKTSKEKNKRKLFTLGSNNSISFDSLEIISRVSKKTISINNINKLPLKIKKKVLFDLKNICKKKKNCKFKIKRFADIDGSSKFNSR